VPTFAEVGLPGFDLRMWFGVFAPGATPAALVEHWAAEVVRAAQAPDVVAKLSAQAFAPFVLKTAAFSSFLQAESARYARIVKAKGIKAD
jgi:tripartite-type tricarboxylate transporter receptor subunit TctC